MRRRLRGLAASLTLTSLLLLTLAPGVWAASADGQLQRLKRVQRQVLMREPAEKLEKRASVRKGHQRRLRAGSRLRGRPLPGPGDLGTPVGANARPARTSALAGVATPPNRQANHSAGEQAGACQSEVSIASYGNFVVAAWNDGIGVYDVPQSDTQGFGYSTDGGVTWVDGGVPPTANVGKWNSDPVVVVDEKTGAFYFAALCDPSTSENGIGVVRGTFNGNSFSWGTPTLVALVDNAVALLDKNWMAVDSLTGNLYVSYTYFEVVNGTVVSDQIRIVRSIDDGQTWIGDQMLSNPLDAGLVQGARPAVGPDGEVYVVWHALGRSDPALPNMNSPFGRDFLRLRKSTDGGATFAAEVTADSLFSNFGSGGPGFNRGMGITFPGIAVDRSNGPRRGRVYLIWNESLNFYNDPFPDPQLDFALSRNEIEPNNGPPVATPFTPGQLLRGVNSVTGSPPDFDYWRFDGNQGETVIFYLDSLRTTLDAALRLWCSNGATLLGFSQNGVGGEDLLVFTLPTTATYYIRVASYSGSRTGGYRILTTVNSPQSDRARDHRDVFAKASDDGQSWGPIVRVNDSPERFDDWLPEVAVDGSGRVFAAHYDFRDAVTICGAGSNVYLARSDNGGTTWIPEIRISDVTTNWTDTRSDLIPNQGDYIALFARDSTVFVGWGDGRSIVSPDVYVASATFACTSAPISLVGAQADTETVVVTWSAPDGLPATVYRRLGTGAYVDLGPVTSGPGDQIVFVDATVEARQTYSYRLGVQGFCQPFVGEVTVVACLSSQVSLVDARATMDTVTVTWSAPAGLPATLYRRVASGSYQSLGPVTADAGGQIVYVDLGVVDGQTYSYRLGVQGFCEPFAGEVTVVVPGTLVFELALYGFVPNPTAGDVNVYFSLTSGERATLALYDITGRQLQHREVGTMGPGPHAVNLTQGVPIRAGVYFVRLSQGGRTKHKRVAIIP